MYNVINEQYPLLKSPLSDQDLIKSMLWGKITATSVAVLIYQLKDFGSGIQIYVQCISKTILSSL